MGLLGSSICPAPVRSQTYIFSYNSKKNKKDWQCKSSSVNSLSLLPCVRHPHNLRRGSEDLFNQRLGISTIATPRPALCQRGVHDEEGWLRCWGLGSEGLRNSCGRFGGDLERHVWWFWNEKLSEWQWNGWVEVSLWSPRWVGRATSTKDRRYLLRWIDEEGVQDLFLQQRITTRVMLYDISSSMLLCLLVDDGISHVLKWREHAISYRFHTWSYYGVHSIDNALTFRVPYFYCTYNTYILNYSGFFSRFSWLMRVGYNKRERRKWFVLKVFQHSIFSQEAYTNIWLLYFQTSHWFALWGHVLIRK